MPEPKMINVVFLYVAQMQQACEFYQSVVGFGEPVLKTPDWVEYKLEQGTHFALHRTDPQCLEDVDRSRNTVKFSIVVEDLQLAYEQMRDKGVTFTRTPETGYGFKIAEFLDLEGNEIRLLQYTTLKRPQ